LDLKTVHVLDTTFEEEVQLGVRLLVFSNRICWYTWEGRGEWCRKVLVWKGVDVERCWCGKVCS